MLNKSIKYLILFVALFTIAACGGGSGGSSGTTNTQETFVTTRGLPSIFMIQFSDEEIGDDGLVQQTDVRRIESWIYDGYPTKTVIFDNGYFVKESLDYTNTFNANAKNVAPSDFNESTSRSDIIDMFGNPDSEEFNTIEGQTLQVLHYDESSSNPVMSFGFVGGDLTSVVVGFAYDVS